VAVVDAEDVAVEVADVLFKLQASHKTRQVFKTNAFLEAQIDTSVPHEMGS
jgi:hypothetical protein